VNSDPKIRPEASGDASRLREIIDLSFSRFVRFFAVHSLTEEGQVLVADTPGGVAVGFAKLVEFQIGADKFGCVLWIAVHPQFRRKRIGTALVEAALERFKDAQAKAVFASVRRRNTASLEMFSTKGFRKIGFLELRRLFDWQVFRLYREIWFAPGEIVLMHS